MITVKIDGILKFDNRLTTLGLNVKNRKNIMEKISTAMLFSVRSNFWDEKGSSGRLKPLKYRKVPPPPLRLTGNLFMSLKARASQDVATVGTNVKYAPKHNFGEGKVPQREFMWLADDDKARVNNIFMEGLLK